jgi:hypothetical protein
MFFRHDLPPLRLPESIYFRRSLGYKNTNEMTYLEWLIKRLPDKVIVGQLVGQMLRQ